MVDRIPGGVADKNKPSDFDQKQLEAGIREEMEHTNDRNVAREIAMDHLKKDPEYYTNHKSTQARRAGSGYLGKSNSLLEGRMIDLSGTPRQVLQKCQTMNEGDVGKLPDGTVLMKSGGQMKVKGVVPFSKAEDGEPEKRDTSSEVSGVSEVKDEETEEEEEDEETEEEEEEVEKSKLSALDLFKGSHPLNHEPGSFRIGGVTYHRGSDRPVFPEQSQPSRLLAKAQASEIVPLSDGAPVVDRMGGRLIDPMSGLKRG